MALLFCADFIIADRITIISRRFVFVNVILTARSGDFFLCSLSAKMIMQFSLKVVTNLMLE